MSDGDKLYKVVRNDEDQYSIWFVDMSIPEGWHDVGKKGSKQECLDFIEDSWTDMRPLSIREGS